jgi:hypothetical protein
MDIDEDSSRSAQPITEEDLDLSEAALHERVYPANAKEPPTVPYLELPDHRPTQAALPPLTIRFKRHHVEAPTEFDDTGAKTKIVRYIN